MTDKITNRKLPDDEELEKLWAGMSREATREAANQNAPKRRTPKNKPSPADYDRWGKVGIKFNNEPIDK